MTERTRSDSPTKLCTMDGCGRALRARGLCGTHYNQQRQTPEQRHPKVTVPCGFCGEPCVKGKGRDRRYTAVFCSLLCRDLWRIETGISSAPRRRGPRKRREPRLCRIPASHPSQWHGATCPVKYRTCAWCAVVYPSNPKRLTRSYCSLGCKKRARKVRRRTNEVPGCFGEWTWSQFMHVARRFEYRCAYCDIVIIGLPDPDHVVPVSRGGPNVVGNLLPSCRPCNSDKRDLSLSAWEIDRARRGLPQRATSWPPEDQRYFHLIPSCRPT